jgi:hypothetical protein
VSVSTKLVQAQQSGSLASSFQKQGLSVAAAAFAAEPSVLNSAGVEKSLAQLLPSSESPAKKDTVSPGN